MTEMNLEIFTHTSFAELGSITQLNPITEIQLVLQMGHANLFSFG